MKDWYRNGKGVAIDVDANKLTVLDLENRDIVMGASDFAAHGQVHILPNGELKLSSYDFGMHKNSPIRNFETKIGAYIAGSGQKFDTNFYGKPTVWKW